MVDSRDKGKRGEYAVRDLLRTKTNLEWERVPGSGGFGSQHGLKGDIYLPISTGSMSKYCFEVKHYKDEQLTSNILNIGESQLEKWWSQTVREAGDMNMKPALIFKKDRGAWLIALSATDSISSLLIEDCGPYLVFGKKDYELVIGKFEPWLHHIKIEDLVK